MPPATRRGGALGLDQERPPGVAAPVRVGGERAAVDRPRVRRVGSDSGEVEDRRGEVDIGDRRRDLDPLADRRPADHQRHLQRLLVGLHLLGPDPVLAVHVAVVGGEDHVGARAQVRRLDRRLDPAHRAVDRQQAGQLAAVTLGQVADLARLQLRPSAHGARLVGHVLLVERGRHRQLPPGEGASVAGRGLRLRGLEGERLAVRAAAPGGVVAPPAPVRGDVGDMEEERARGARVGADVGQRVVAGQGVGDVVGGPVAVVDLAAARVGDVVAVVVDHRRCGHRPEAVPAGCRVERPVVVQPLADQGRVVAGLVEPDREDVLGVAQGLIAAAVALLVVDHAVVVGVLAGDPGGARGAAEGEGDDAAGEAGAAVDQQPVDLRHHPQRGERLVVGADQDDVRPACRAGGGAAATAARHDHQHAEHQGRDRGAEPRPAHRRGPPSSALATHPGPEQRPSRAVSAASFVRTAAYAGVRSRLRSSPGSRSRS